MKFVLSRDKNKHVRQKRGKMHLPSNLVQKSLITFFEQGHHLKATWERKERLGKSQ